jgi:hypothetical protein
MDGERGEQAGRQRGDGPRVLRGDQHGIGVKVAARDRAIASASSMALLTQTAHAP